MFSICLLPEVAITLNDLQFTKRCYLNKAISAGYTTRKSPKNKALAVYFHMTLPRIIKNKKKRILHVMDPKKECLIKELCNVMNSYGYIVRREHLKQGLGWKVLSGSCRRESEKMIFVDRKLPQAEQLTFLLNRIVSAEERPNEELLKTLSDETRNLLINSYASLGQAQAL